MPYTRCAAEEMPNPAATRPRGDADRGPPPRPRADVAGPGGVRGGQAAEGALARAARRGGPVGKRAVPRPESAPPQPSVARKVSSPFLSFGTHPLRVILTVTGEGCRKRAAPAGPRGSRRARARPSPGRSRCSSRVFPHALTNSSRRKSPSASKARNFSSRRFVLRDHDEVHGRMVHNTQPAGPRPRGCAFARGVRKTSEPSAQAPNNIPGYSRARFSRTVLAVARKTGADGRKPPCEI